MRKIQEHLSRNIKERRRILGYTQAQLAERVNSAPNYISLIETGHKFPSPSMLEKIADALSVESCDLFQGKDHGLKNIEDFEAELIMSVTDSIQHVVARHETRALEKR